MPATTRHHAALELLAREIHVLFPRCVRCGTRIERFEEAEVKLFGLRVYHRERCERSDER
jgi:hypothetical protein